MGDSFLKRNLYVAACCSIAFVMPLSEWLLTFFIVILSLLWVFSGGLKRIPDLAGRKRTILVFLGIWVVYLVWMVNTSDLASGLRELKIKLPLVVFPLVFGLSGPAGNREVKAIMSSFIAGVMVSTLYGTITNIGPVISGFADNRTLSPFISHIRLALMALFAIALAGWYYYRSEKKTGWALLFLVPVFWLITYLSLLISATGIFLMAVIIFLTLLKIASRSTSFSIKASVVLFLTAILISCGLVLSREIRSFYTPGNKTSREPMEFTANGNPYRHDISRKDIENGNKVWINICETELKKQWNLKSRLSFDSTDKKGQILKYTITRYLASAGLTKDSAGFTSLTPADIMNIEQGMTNIKFSEWSRFKKKVYETIWQIDYYRNGGNPSGHSVTQRIEFIKTGWRVFLRVPLFGTGTGDLTDEFKKQYKSDNSQLDEDHRLISHNQFLTFLISFGITGFFIICFSLFFPVVKSGACKRYPAFVFLIIIFLSMLWEDTLQTHTGVSFFAYFYSLFIFGIYNYEKGKKEE